MISIEYDIKELNESFISFLRDKGYLESALGSYISKSKRLSNFLGDNGLKLTISNIDVFYSEEIEKSDLSNHTKSLYRTFINRLKDFLSTGEYVIEHNFKPISVISEKNTIILDKYLKECEKKLNKLSTISGKKKIITRFINILENECKIFDLGQITKELIEKILPSFNAGKKDSYPVIAQFLEFLVRQEILDYDYSQIIPKFKTVFVLPTVYKEDEIKKLEDVIDTSTVKGKRDKAMVMMASRLGIRVSDIISTTADNLDFKNNKISFIQAKTGVYIELPMVDDVKTALLEYLEVKPKSNYKQIFLRTRNPIVPVSGTALNYVLKDSFDKAGVNTTNKKHGPHSLRLSLASSMVNDDIPYEIVRKALGHTNPDVIKHYARIDIEKLRKCALNVPEPTGNFKKFLSGGFGHDF